MRKSLIFLFLLQLACSTEPSSFNKKGFYFLANDEIILASSEIHLKFSSKTIFKHKIYNQKTNILREFTCDEKGNEIIEKDYKALKNYNFLLKLKNIGKSSYEDFINENEHSDHEVAVWFHPGYTHPPKDLLYKNYHRYTEEKRRYKESLRNKMNEIKNTLNLPVHPNIHNDEFPFVITTLNKKKIVELSKNTSIKHIARVSKKFRNLMENITSSFGFSQFHQNNLHGQGILGDKVKVVIVEFGRPSNSNLPQITVRDPNAPITGDYKEATDHATRVAGIIASQKLDLLGLSHKVDLYMANFNCPPVGNPLGGTSYSCTAQQSNQNYLWAANQGPAIWNISMAPIDSFGAEEHWRLYLEYLSVYSQVLPIAAVGNITNWVASDCSQFPLPCKILNHLKNGLIVGGTDDKNTASRSDDEIHPLSAWINLAQGEEYPHIVASAYKVQSLCYDVSQPSCNDKDNGSQGKNGTSFSAPQVASLAALISSTNYIGYDSFKYWPEAVRAIVLASSIHDTDGTNYYSPYPADVKDGAGAIDAQQAFQILSNGRWNPSLTTGNYDYRTVYSSDFPIEYPVFLESGSRLKSALVWDRHVNCSDPSPLSGCSGYAPIDDLDLTLRCFDGYSWNVTAFSNSYWNEWETFQYLNSSPFSKFCKISIEKWSFNSSYNYIGIAWKKF